MYESYTALKPILFALFFMGAMGVFTASCWRLFRMLALSKDHPGLFKNPVDRFGDVIYYVFFQKRVVDQKFGWNHVIFFWSFVIITIGHVEFILRGIYPPFSLHFLGDFVYSWILRGGDLMALIVLAAVGNALFRRFVIRPSHIDWKSEDGVRILGMISNVMITYFLAMGAGLLGGHPDVADYGKWLPVSSMVSGVYGLFAIDPDNARHIFYELFWWAHATVLFAFLNYIPHSKHLHLLGAIPNIYLRKDEKPKSALSVLDFENSESFGVGKVTDFTWKALLDTYACTECGRCDLFCPANRTGKPLKPQKVIHDMKANLVHNGMDVVGDLGWFNLKAPKEDWEPKLALLSEDIESAEEHGQIAPETLWSCTTCGACVDACPVLIDHVDSILDMRRHLTLMEGAIAPELATTFKNIENNYNPWGIGADKRADWADGLGLKYWGSSEDADKFEYLFWVGCAGSYDNRAQKVMKSFTRILDAAGITYAILGTKEKCTGDPVRRTGNEYQFDAMARENVETLNDLGVKKIVTACPHCFNTLKNEYPPFGGSYEVIHHSQLIAELLDHQRLDLDDAVMQTVTFHDPCYLGRWNGEFEAPRRTLAAQRHLNVVEMADSKRQSMCCGAGGGQMWMEEQEGKERVNSLRTEQILETRPDTVAVACPFCMTMIEDGMKEKGREDEVQVLDIAELVDKALIGGKRPAEATRAGTDAARKTAPTPVLAKSTP